MTNPSDPDTLADRVAESRRSLAETLENLQDRVSVDHLARDALDAVRANAAAYTRSIDRAVRANPIALALAGVGVAWLVLGSRGGDEAGEGPSRVEGEAWSARVDQMRDRASRSLYRIERDAADYAQAMRDGLIDEVDTARDYAAERATVVADFAADLREGFVHGLEGLSSDARERISAARERAYAAALKARRTAAMGAARTGRMIEDHPIVAGVCAAALGAAIAAVLPRTRTEDRTFGAERDRLMDEARRLLAEERERAREIAGGVAEELRDGARATMEAVSDRVAETGEAMRERAREEARGDGGGDRSGGGAGQGGGKTDRPAGGAKADAGKAETGKAQSASGDAGKGARPAPGGAGGTGGAGQGPAAATGPGPGRAPQKP